MENYYKNLLYYLPDIVYQIDVDGRILYINDSVRKLGYEPDELVGEFFDVIIDEQDRRQANLLHFISDRSGTESDAPQPKFVNERRTGTRITKNLVVKLTPKPGNSEVTALMTGEVFATGLYDDSPEGKHRHSGTIGIIRFTGNDLKSQKNLQRLENHYRVLLENSFEIITILAFDGTILYISNSVERNLGFSTMELIGENIESLISEQDLYVIKSVFKKLYGTGKTIEFRLKDKSGRWRVYETLVTSIMNADSDVTMCYVFHMNDITRRKEIEMSAMKREQVYKTLLRTSPDAILLVDEQGDIIMANDQALNLTGLVREDLLGIALGDLISTDDAIKPGDLFSRVDRAGIIRDMPFSIVKKSRRKVPVEASFSPIRDGNATIGYLSIIRDVTERRKAETERQKLENDLLTIVINRLSKREIELLRYIHAGYRWPGKKREIGKKMNVLPSTLDQFIYRVKKKMELTDLDKIVRIASLHFKWPKETPDK